MVTTTTIELAPVQLTGCQAVPSPTVCAMQSRVAVPALSMAALEQAVDPMLIEADQHAFWSTKTILGPSTTTNVHVEGENLRQALANYLFLTQMSPRDTSGCCEEDANNDDVIPLARGTEASQMVPAVTTAMEDHLPTLVM